MLGLVLGTLRLPFMVLAAGSPLAAAGTNIAISAAAAGAGGLAHARAGRVDWRVVAWMAPPSIAGAIAGALVADDVSEALLYGLIAGVLVWSGIDLALRPISARPRERLRVGRGSALAFGIGVLGGAVGVILGTLRMPALVRSVGLDVRRAAGTNLVVGFLLGCAGFATYAAGSGVEWGLLAAGLVRRDPWRLARGAHDRQVARERAAGRTRSRADPRRRDVRRASGHLVADVPEAAADAKRTPLGLRATGIRVSGFWSCAQRAYATAGQRSRSHSTRSSAERGVAT